MKTAAGVRLVGCAVLSALVVLPSLSWAGFEEGMTAFSRGDFTTAMREWLPLAQQGNATAQFGLGVMYDQGRGVPQDYAKALKWYRLAAAQGDAGAQFNLGVMCARGQGVPQDYVQAHMWYSLAASGFPPGPQRHGAVQARGSVAKQMTPAQLAEAERLAREWKPKQ